MLHTTNSYYFSQECSLFLYDNGAKTRYFSLRTLSFCITMVQLLCRSKLQRGMGHEEKEKKPRFFINDNTDILMEILKRLDGRSLGVAACVCQLWRSVTWNDSLWEHLCFRHVSPPPPGVRPVVLALGGYRRLYMMCLRPVLSRLGQMKHGLGGGGGCDSDLVGRVWTRDSVQLSLSLFCVDYYERLDGRLGDASTSSLMFLCKPVNV